MSDHVIAPWTPEQVDHLNTWQTHSGMHPMTCGYDHPDRPRPNLIATVHGWRCLYDDYQQDWTPAFTLSMPARGLHPEVGQ